MRPAGLGGRCRELIDGPLGVPGQRAQVGGAVDGILRVGGGDGVGDRVDHEAAVLGAGEIIDVVLEVPLGGLGSLGPVAGPVGLLLESVDPTLPLLDLHLELLDLLALGGGLVGDLLHVGDEGLHVVGGGVGGGQSARDEGGAENGGDAETDAGKETQGHSFITKRWPVIATDHYRLLTTTE